MLRVSVCRQGCGQGNHKSYFYSFELEYPSIHFFLLYFRGLFGMDLQHNHLLFSSPFLPSLKHPKK